MPKRPKTGAAGTAAIRTAEMLIARHGKKALTFARDQMERLAAAGALDSAADWRAVVWAIEDLERRPPEG